MTADIISFKSYDKENHQRLRIHNLNHNEGKREYKSPQNILLNDKNINSLKNVLLPVESLDDKDIKIAQTLSNVANSNYNKSFRESKD